MPDRTHIVVHPASLDGSRAVTAHVHGEDRPLGTACSLPAVVDMFRAAGLETAAGWPPIRWLGGGPEAWGD
ncbi:hypothetical protein [Streptomyces sp. NBC_01233]|uniref:hypothetical protein n=1 Tax=Streptomyces sp. NBC_01233 TaxID=2903787 RepID=UPI002E0E6547|nr:hypothetical protein OG332_37420 [Streptomyces sp. NBC_01233]